jgi:hypothetical protein
MDESFPIRNAQNSGTLKVMPPLQSIRYNKLEDRKTGGSWQQMLRWCRLKLQTAISYSMLNTIMSCGEFFYMVPERTEDPSV